MEEIAQSVGTKLAEMSIDKAIQEARYLCCYQSYVNEFDDQRKKLSDAACSVHEDIKDARDRNETRIDPIVQGWLEKADDLIKQDTKVKTKCFFGICTNWFWQNRRSKELEEMAKKIPELIQNTSNFARVARKAGLPGMEYYSSPDFVYFESRKQEYEQLKEALRNERNHMIGLQGMGGTGKTTMAAQVGKELEESKVFDRVIFFVVSTSPDVKKIQGHIARHLGLTLEEGKGSDVHAESLWSRIANGGEKILIILDDVWDKDLNLKAIGIPHVQLQKGRCSVLITTRDMNVCEEMGCQETTIEIGVLYDEDAVNLFLLHADKSVDGSSDELKEVALAIVKECGRLPVAIVAMARSLKKCSLEELRGALRRLQNFEPNNVPDNLKGVYSSLKLSYDNLGNEKAKSLFLICSLFPEDFEIPMLLFNVIAIGLGLCGEANEYYTARSQVPEIKYKLIDSCLLLKGEKECMKMHDLIREVAQWIGKEESQVEMDSQTALKKNVRYLSWVADGLPDGFDCRKLEFLLVQTSTDDVQDSLFEGMMELRVLLFSCSHMNRHREDPSWLKSILVLKNIRTLCLTKWYLGDISILGKLQTLEALELNDCEITEFPNEIRELKKLRLLSLISCGVWKNNPFEVIERCQQLEELYFVRNAHYSHTSEDEQLHSENTKPLVLRRYHIEGWEMGRDAEQIASTTRCFIEKDLNTRLSKATLESLVARANILEFGEHYETGWRNLIPDIAPMKEDGLIRISLYCLPEMECLINTKNVQSGSGVSIFSKLVELQLYDMDVKELCCGPLPKYFLKELKEICLQNCLKLDGTLFRDKLDLGNLKLIRLHNCSMEYLFCRSTAQSLRLLETLEIYGCYKLKCIIMDEGSGKEKANDLVPGLKSHESMFPKLRFVDVRYCGQLECLFPICFAEDTPQLEEVIIDKCGKLKYIFGQSQDGKESILPSLKKVVILRVPDFINIYPKCYNPMSSGMQNSSQTTRDGPKVKDPSPSHSFSWAPICCFQPRLSATSIENPTVSEATLPEYSGSQSQGTVASKTEWIFDTAESVLRQPLNPQDMRDMEIPYYFTCSSPMFTEVPLTSLFLMERLPVEESHGDGTKEIATEKDDGDDDGINCELRYLIVSNNNADDKLRYMLKRCSWEDNPPLENQDARENIQYLFSLLAQAMTMIPKTLKHLYLVNEEIDSIYQSRISGVHFGNVNFVELDTMKLENLPIRCLYEKYDSRPFRNISKLEISGCQRLEFIFPESSYERYMHLRHIVISNCQYLEYLYEKSVFDRSWKKSVDVIHFAHIEVSNCKSLKSLFPMSGLHSPDELMQCEEDNTSMMSLYMSTLQLINLPNLTTVFPGNDFRNIKNLDVRDCPRLSYTSSTTMDGNNEESHSQLQPTSSEGKLSPSHIQEIEEASDEDGPELNESTTPDQTIISEQSQPSQEPCVISSENKSQQDTFVDEEAKKEKNITDQQALAKAMPENAKVSNGEGPSSEKDNKPISTAHSEQDIDSSVGEGTPSEKEKEAISSSQLAPETSHPGPLISTKEFHDTKPSQDSTSTNEDPGRVDKQFNKTQKDSVINQVVTNLLEDTTPLSEKKATTEVDEKDSERYQQNKSTPNLTEKNEASAREGPLLEKYHKATSSTHSEPVIAYSDPLTSTKEFREKESMGDREELADNTQEVEEPNNEHFSKARSNKTALAIPPAFAAMKDSASNAVGRLKVNEIKTDTDKDDEVAQLNPQFEEDDLIRLFLIVEEGADIRGHMPCVSKISALQDDDKVAKAFSEVQVLLKMNVSEVASSIENSLRLENALNFLSHHYSEDGGAPSRKLKAKIDTMHQEISRILSSFQQASARLASIDTFTKLEEKDKCIDEELPMRKEAALTLVSEIHMIKKSMQELTEDISRLQAELNSKEKQIQECKIKLSEKENSIWETIGFLEDYEATKEDKSQIEEDTMMARQELEKVNNKWSSCEAKWWKTLLLQRIYGKQKL